MAFLQNFLFMFCMVVGFLCIPFTVSVAVEDSRVMAGGPASGRSVRSGEGVSLRVLWTVTGYLPGANAALSDVQARNMLFKALDITTTSITFAGQTCENIVFEKEEVSADEYLRTHFQVDPRNLRITETSIEVIRTNCRLPGFAEYVKLGDRRLIVPIEGVLFIFEPAVDY